jgi:hypothetical protein
MPTAPNTHEHARAVVPGARVAYVDNDPVVLRRLRELPAQGVAGVTAVDGDAPAAAAGLVARYARALAAGSYVILTMGVASGAAAEQFFRLYSEGPTKLYRPGSGMLGRCALARRTPRRHRPATPG